MCHVIHLFQLFVLTGLSVIAATIIILTAALIGFARRLDRTELITDFRHRHADTVWTNTCIRRHRRTDNTPEASQ